MQDLVIIPTYDRPELLWLCLEYLARSPDGPRVQIRVYVDAHVGHSVSHRDDITTVLNKFPQLSLQVGYRQPHRFHGNSYNVLMAYKDAYQTTARYVFLIEDDVLIHPEFFSWHTLMHTDRELGCSIAVTNPGHGAYASLGVCFRRETLRLVLPHCNATYFQNMRGYCKATFPPSKFDYEQDGLLARVLKDHPVVWASTPYAQHIGWYGYHRKKSVRPTGSLEDRFYQVKQVLANTAILHEWVKDFGDIRPVLPCN